MKILHEETIGGVRYRLTEDGAVRASYNETGDGVFVLRKDGSRLAEVPRNQGIYKAAESIRARNWDRLRPLEENEQRTDDGLIRTWEWRGDEFGSQLTTDPEFRPLSFWVWARSNGGEYARTGFDFGLALARKTCPPHLAVLDDGMIYRMADDEARENHVVHPCSWWDGSDLNECDPGQRERVEAWRQAKGGKAVEVEVPRDARESYYDPTLTLQTLGEKLLADKPPSFEIDGTTYFRADHPRVLRGDEFRVPMVGPLKCKHCDLENSVPIVVDSDGDRWEPWGDMPGIVPQESIDILRAFWLANYQFAPGEYLDEEAGVVRRSEPEAKKLEPFFTDSDGDVWEFVKTRNGWVAIDRGGSFGAMAYNTDETGAPAQALRAYVASVGEGES